MRRGLSASDVRRMKRDSERKDLRQLLQREFDASRMNSTKWMELVDGLGDLRPCYRIQFVDVAAVTPWMGLWAPALGWFESCLYTPFETLSIEWLEIDPSHHFGPQGEVTETDLTREIEARLRSAQFPCHWDGPSIRVTGHVRKASPDKSNRQEG